MVILLQYFIISYNFIVFNINSSWLMLLKIADKNADTFLKICHPVKKFVGMPTRRHLILAGNFSTAIVAQISLCICIIARTIISICVSVCFRINLCVATLY